MATITSLAQASTSTTGGTKQWKAGSWLYKFTLDFADAATAKGSALAAADIIECIRVPAGCVVESAGAYVVTAVSGGSADETITIGDGGSAARYATGFDLDAAVAGGMTSQIPANVPFTYTVSDTIDVTLAGTTLPTAGKLIVFANLYVVKDVEKIGLAQIRS